MFLILFPSVPAATSLQEAVMVTAGALQSAQVGTPLSSLVILTIFRNIDTIDFLHCKHLEQFWRQQLSGYMCTRSDINIFK